MAMDFNIYLSMMSRSSGLSSMAAPSRYWPVIQPIWWFSLQYYVIIIIIIITIIIIIQPPNTNLHLLRHEGHLLVQPPVEVHQPRHDGVLRNKQILFKPGRIFHETKIFDKRKRKYFKFFLVCS